MGVFACTKEKQAYCAGTHLMGKPERRKFKRSSVKLALSFHKVGRATQRSHKGYTLNVSPGGLYFRTPVSELKPGSLLRVELSVPPTPGVLELGGKISGFARVLRTEDVGASDVSAESPSGSHGVALAFCQRPKLCL